MPPDPERLIARAEERPFGNEVECNLPKIDPPGQRQILAGYLKEPLRHRPCMGGDRDPGQKRGKTREPEDDHSHRQMHPAGQQDREIGGDAGRKIAQCPQRLRQQDRDEAKKDPSGTQKPQPARQARTPGLA